MSGGHIVEQIGRRPVMRAVSATVLSATGERLADFRHVADANLFAATPDLLAALDGFPIREKESDADYITLILGWWITCGSKALAKAEGRS